MDAAAKKLLKPWNQTSNRHPKNMKAIGFRENKIPANASLSINFPSKRPIMGERESLPEQKQAPQNYNNKSKSTYP